jgi:Ca2+-binding EF-hand superfamily protein
LIREKIAANTTRSSDQIRQAMKIFGGKTAVVLDEFRAIVKKLGIEASPGVTATLFDRYDLSGDKHLDLYEFVKVSPTCPLSSSDCLSVRG